MRVFAARHYFEITGAGYNGERSDDRILWVHGTQIDVMAATAGTGARWVQLDHGPDLDSDLDFALPAEARELRARLLSYKETVR